MQIKNGDNEMKPTKPVYVWEEEAEKEIQKVERKITNLYLELT